MRLHESCFTATDSIEFKFAADYLEGRLVASERLKDSSHVHVPLFFTMINGLLLPSFPESSTFG
jgi:hypothetical protein